MKTFVEECRREWRRLRVPEAVANEMASDLASDLAEAEAEGVSVEEVLGRSAFDPRAFAASWAAERGVIPVSPAHTEPPRSRVNVAVAVALSAVGALAAAVIVLASRGGSSIAVEPVGHAPTLPPDISQRLSGMDVAEAVAGVLFVVGILALLIAGYLWMSWRRSRAPAVPA